MKLDGSTALVTGANRGLGRQLAEQLVSRGATVYAAARRPETIEIDGVIPVALDVTDERSITAAAELARDVSVLINNAGSSTGASVVEGPWADIRLEMETHYFGTLATTRAFAPQLAAAGTSAVLNVLSVLSWVNLPGGGAYSAAKAAEWSLTNALRLDLAGQGTTVTGLHVGYMDTDMARHVEATQERSGRRRRPRARRHRSRRGRDPRRRHQPAGPRRVGRRGRRPLPAVRLTRRGGRRAPRSPASSQYGPSGGRHGGGGGGGAVAVERGRGALDITDAITAETIRNALAVAVEEASIVVVRSSHSTFIQEGADACAALLDAEGRLVAQSASTSLMHGASLRCSLPALLEDHPLDTMRPGDVFAMNDPFRGGIHANDIVDLPARLRRRTAAVRSPARSSTWPTSAGRRPAGSPPSPPTPSPRACCCRPCASTPRAPSSPRCSGSSPATAGCPPRSSATSTPWSPAPTRWPAGSTSSSGATAPTRSAPSSTTPSTTASAASARSSPSSPTAPTEGRSPSTPTASIRAARSTCGSRSPSTATGSSSTSTAPPPSPAAPSTRRFSQTTSGVLFAVRCFVDPSIPMNEGCFRPVEVRPPARLDRQPRPAGGLRRARGHGGGRHRRHPRRPVGVPGPITRWRRAAWCTCSPSPASTTRAGAGSPCSTSSAASAPGGERRSRRHRCLLPRRSLGHPPDRAAGGPVPVHRVGGRGCGPTRAAPGRWRGGLGVETAIELLVDTEITVRGDRMRVPPPGVAGGWARGRPAGSDRVRRADGTVEQLAPRSQAGGEGARRRRVRAAHVRRRRRSGEPSATRRPGAGARPTCA